MRRTQIILITLLTLALSVTAMANPRGKGGPEGPGFQIGKWLLNNPDIELTDDQITAVENILDGQEREMIQHRADQELLHLEIRDLILADASQSKINAAIDKLEKGRSDMMKQQTQNLMKVRKLLDDDQKKVLDRMIKSNRLGRKGPRGHEHHGRGPGFNDGPGNGPGMGQQGPGRGPRRGNR